MVARAQSGAQATRSKDPGVSYQQVPQSKEAVIVNLPMTSLAHGGVRLQSLQLLLTLSLCVWTQQAIPAGERDAGPGPVVQIPVHGGESMALQPPTGRAHRAEPGGVADNQAHPAATDSGTAWNDYFRPDRTEALLDQGRRAVTENRFDRAEEFYDQALQINRASFGLHNPTQLEILDLTLEALLLQRKWDQFAQKLDYIDWLTRRIYAEEPQQLARSLQRRSRWHLAAAAAIGNTQSAWYLIRGKYLDWQAVSVLEQHVGPNDVGLAPVLYQIVLTHFYQTVSIERRGMTSFDFKTDARTVANGWSASRSETVRRSYRIGREILERIRSIHRNAPGSSPITDALLGIHLADWEFLYGKGEEALAHYRDAYFALVRAGIGEAEVDAYFSQVQPLPAARLQTEWQAPDSPDESNVVDFIAWSTVYPGAQAPPELRRLTLGPAENSGSRVTAALTLELTGESNPQKADFDYRVADTAILRVQPEGQSAVDRALAEIPLLKFRPRLVAGELAVHDTVRLEYRLAGTGNDGM